jgi:hypothetical protein
VYQIIIINCNSVEGIDNVKKHRSVIIYTNSKDILISSSEYLMSFPPS